jgi:hypothetical protein
MELPRGKKQNTPTNRILPDSKSFEDRMRKRGYEFKNNQSQLPNNVWGNKFNKIIKSNCDDINLNLYYEVFNNLKLQGLKNLYRYLSLHLDGSSFQYSNIERIFNLENARNKFMEDLDTYLDNDDYLKMLVVYENYFIPQI